MPDPRTNTVPALHPTADLTEDGTLPVPDPDSGVDFERPDTAPPWSDFSGADPLQAWAEDLRTALASGTVEDWEIAGRAGMVVTHDDFWGAQALHRVAVASGLECVVVFPSFVDPLPSPESLTARGPVLVIAARGPWSADAQEMADDDVRATIEAAQDWLRALVDPSPEWPPIVVGMTEAAVTDCCVSLRRPGLVDRFMVLPPRTDESLGRQVIAAIGEEACGPSLTERPDLVGYVFRQEYAEHRRHDLAVLQLRRLARSRRRRVEFRDLIALRARGFGMISESHPGRDAERRRSAVHEAGHAVAAIAASGGRWVPDHVTILPALDYDGAVIYDTRYFAESGTAWRYDEVRYRVRLALAGRASEELAYGIAGLSSSCDEDLESASSLVFRAFTRWGFSPSMAGGSESGDNLYVARRRKNGGGPDLPPQVHAEVIGWCRGFLEAEYRAARTLLERHRGLRDAIVRCLLEAFVLDRADLERLLVREYGAQWSAAMDAPPPGLEL